MEKIRLATQSDIEAVTDIYDRIHKMEASAIINRTQVPKKRRLARLER